MTLQVIGGGQQEEEVDDGEDEVFGNILGTATDYGSDCLEGQGISGILKNKKLDVIQAY